MRPFKLASSLVASAALLLLLLVLLLPSTTHHNGAAVVQAREVEATHEWTLLGENDTVAAGMHIRMDMTTGEKWVKLMDDDDNQEKSASSAAAARGHDRSNSRQVQVSALGATTVLNNDNNDASASASDEPHYDFDMMYRTLSKLPEEEIERIQLPEKPSEESMSPEARVIFQRQMKQIWEERQEQLRIVSADLPQLLKDRIRAIREYLEDPATHLLQLLDADAADESQTESESVAEKDIPAEEKNQIVHIIHVLQDLEYHLQDLDMTRDFHTLGGWSLLASLLRDHVHFTTTTATIITQSSSRNGNNETTITSVEVTATDQIHRVQMHAAWALGTAVKNTAEFTPYVVEKIKATKDKNDSDSDGLTALDLVFRQLQTSLLNQDQTAVTETKILRLVYCLGSFLRGNRAAQIHFGASEGPAFLSSALQTFVDIGKEAFATKMSVRLLNLASDAVLDVTLHRDNDIDDEKSGSNYNNNKVDDAIVAAWTSKQWCSAIVSAMERPELQDAAVSTVHALAPYCKSSWQPAIAAVVSSVKKVRTLWEESATEIDPELHQERIQLIGSIVDELVS